jgi:hypothetical protein
MLRRIYTYKITFEEVPFFYFGIHKEKKFGELYLGTPVSHKWVWEIYTPRIQILEFFDTWGEGKSVEDRLIRPFLNDPLCLNEAVGFYMSLESCRKGGRNSQKAMKEKGTGVYGPKTKRQLESSRKEGKKLSKYSVENGTRTGKENVELKRGIWGMNPEDLLESCSKGGKSGGKKTGAQGWMDPDHPELGVKPACVLVGMQTRRGFPNKKENRVRVR